ncbi:dihydropteroate synthase [Geosporobacter ferrireducens]|uniref:dihydropteroate synthase n=1 Tax=Geosporobacter ferrireducens TaxID=1424294 RepID=UPI00139F10A6|nr:dihydropteroate synthase [Geosporobacter ferrireducens]MTI56643.1 methyltetrahydrofolate cobalamin methyltransferase [Geosporobacter ferrireducens]
MYIVGELINASRKVIGQAIKEQSSEYIRQIAREQEEAGADYIDVNAGIFVEEEAECLEWLVKNVQAAVDLPCCIDSPSAAALERGLAAHTKGIPMINSISLEKDRYDQVMSIVRNTDLRIVALCMSDKGMPQTRKERVTIADELVNKLVQNGVKIENIFLDPLVQPIGTNDSFGVEFINAVEDIRSAFPEVHFMCGLSNISFGLPDRKYMNSIFAVMAIAKGLDGLMINPLDKKMMANIIVAETLAGKDKSCKNYLKAFRKKKFEF